MKFRKRPVVVEARQFIGSVTEKMAVYQWVEDNTEGSFEPYTTTPPPSGTSIDPASGGMLIATPEGVMHVANGDWIIRGVEGEFYPCKPAIFEATYETADAAPWDGYGPPAEPDQWRSAAEWIHCAAIHGADGLDLDIIAGEVELPWGKVYGVVERVTDALKDVADTIAAGATKEACCYEEQRHNHAVSVEMRAAQQPTATDKE